jgi:hypothetical protein
MDEIVDGADVEDAELRREARQSAVLLGAVMLLVVIGLVIGVAV